LKNESAPFAQADNFLHSFGSGFILSHRAETENRRRPSNVNEKSRAQGSVFARCSPSSWAAWMLAPLSFALFR